ncbi:hypothetical protein [Flaviflagellibacter deserti]|uniref:Uncharacterized protein n=1 Tax=Flaviflagellibacter deserti TaxID=2267266 RepID=A0ABV9YZM9_9HYPH
MKKLSVTLTAALPIFAFAAPASAGTIESIYTRHDYAACDEQKSPEPDVIEVRKCTGLGGIAVVWTGEPDASFVTIGETGDDGLDLGASFFEVGNTIEWRGPKRVGTIDPNAMIVRYVTGKAIGNLDVSKLAVYRLNAGGSSCFLGAASTNQAARAIADESRRCR